MRNVLSTICGFAVYVASPYIWNSSRVVDWCNRHAMRIALAVAALCAVGVALAGCVPSLAPHSDKINMFVDTAIETGADDIARANDRIANVVTKSSCAISLGAFSRLQPTQQWGFLALCTGQMPQLSPVTVVPITPVPATPSSFGLDKALPTPAAIAANPSPTVAP